MGFNNNFKYLSRIFKYRMQTKAEKIFLIARSNKNNFHLELLSLIARNGNS